MIVLDRDHLGLGDYSTRRNAFGRQVRSFEAALDIGDGDEPLRAVFIRAPWLEDAGADVEVLAEVDGHPHDVGLARALDELRFFTTDVKILGVYAADPFRSG